jgi:hypothetical protein
MLLYLLLFFIAIILWTVSSTEFVTVENKYLNICIHICGLVQQKENGSFDVI